MKLRPPFGTEFPTARQNPPRILEVHPVDAGVGKIGQVAVEQSCDVGVEQNKSALQVKRCGKGCGRTSGPVFHEFSA